MTRLVVRFLRVGNFKNAAFWIVVTNSSKRRNFRRFKEKLGFYNPSCKSRVRALGINTMRLGYLMNQGAVINRSVLFILSKLAFFDLYSKHLTRDLARSLKIKKKKFL
jgi:ribosomal protein S16